LQVAQLAGVPQAVIKAARKHLARLESQALDTTPQLDLFALPCVEPEEQAQEQLQQDRQPDQDHAGAGSDLLDALAGIDPDALTPREALERLYQLKRMAAQ
jgi:DNA mismatch repair protein MutS